MELPSLFEVSEKFLPQAQITEFQASLHANTIDHPMQQPTADVHNHNVLYVVNDKGAQ